jgi:hypothetical protein
LTQFNLPLTGESAVTFIEFDANAHRMLRERDLISGKLWRNGDVILLRPGVAFKYSREETFIRFGQDFSTDASNIDDPSQMGSGGQDKGNHSLNVKQVRQLL